MILFVFSPNAIWRKFTSPVHNLLKKFISVNIDVRNEEHGKPPKIFEDELQALLDVDDA